MPNPLLYSAWAANQLDEYLRQVYTWNVKSLINEKVLEGIIEHEYQGKVTQCDLFRLRERFLIPDTWYIAETEDGKLTDIRLTFDSVREKVIDKVIQRLKDRIHGIFQNDKPDSVRFVRLDVPAATDGKSRFRADMGNVSLLCTMGYNSSKQSTEVEFLTSLILNR